MAEYISPDSDAWERYDAYARKRGYYLETTGEVNDIEEIK